MRTDQLAWVQPDGAAFPITGQPDLDVHWALGVDGRFMPPVDLISDRIPGQAGARLREVQVREREVTLPLTVFGPDETGLRERVRQLLRQFDPTRGPGVLRCTSVDGTMRELPCTYRQGLQGREFAGDTGVRWQRMVLVLEAHDPFWQDTNPTEVSYTVASRAPFLSSQFLPMRLTSDTLLGRQTLTNDGDRTAYPVFTIRGPANSFTLANETTGEELTYEAPLAAGEVLTIDTRPFQRTVHLADGTNRYAQLAHGSGVPQVLWHLPSGANTVRLDLTGSTSASYVTVSFRRLWLAP